MCGRDARRTAPILGAMVTPSGRPQDRATRSYQTHGLHAVSRALPSLLARVTDPSVPDDALTPVEHAARAWRSDVMADLGGLEQVSAQRVALLDAATGSKIVLDSVDRYLFALAAQDGLVNRRSRRAFVVVEQRMRVADGLARQLQALGLDRVPQRVTDLASYVRDKYGDGAPDHGDAGRRHDQRDGRDGMKDGQ